MPLQSRICFKIKWCFDYANLWWPTTIKRSLARNLRGGGGGGEVLNGGSVSINCTCISSHTHRLIFIRFATYPKIPLSSTMSPGRFLGCDLRLDFNVSVDSLQYGSKNYKKISQNADKRKFSSEGIVWVWFIVMVVFTCKEDHRVVKKFALSGKPKFLQPFFSILHKLRL